MDTRRPIDAFAWQYAFYAHLVHRRASAPEAQLSDLAQVMWAVSRKQDPRAVAERVMVSWPFAVSPD